MTQSPVLEVQQLGLSRGGRSLIVPLDLQLLAGERGLLHGGNGSGKTTFMETLCGLLPTTEGSVHHLGRIGYVPQEPNFPDHLTCTDYLKQLHQLGGRGRAKRKAEVGLTLQQFQLQKHAFDCIGSLSRGWRQRMNLARAWLGSPELLLLDEPQTALDPSGMSALREAIAQAGQSAVLIVAPQGVGCDDLAPLLAKLQTPESV
ncbi:MAG: ABC transporter ATP-binding protein [Planctomycetota bacterium]|nr:ABC transporter ATP-binding protein [Planctomycetota bacterium]MDA1113995.1 ABC transporter ATP-binding protein [Planctomycetota bacterium]